MKFRTSCALLSSVLTLSVVANAQVSQTTGALRGTVKSKKSGVVRGATLLLRNTETGFTKTVASDSTGAFQFPYLPVGTYELSVSSPGLRSGKGNSIRVTLGETTTQNFDLDAAEASTTVEVVAQSSTVDTSQVSSVSAIGEDMIQSVPLNGRNFTDLVLMTPGASTNAQGFRTSVEGSRGVGNNLQIDGASFNSKFVTEQRGGTRVPFSFGMDTIKELQVITNGYDAQYGDATGAIINAISKNGTNEFTFSGMAQVRPESMVARIRDVPQDTTPPRVNIPAIQERHFNQIQGNFNMGGPLIKDKLFYFVGMETWHYQQDNVPTMTISSGNGNTQPFQDTFLAGAGSRWIVNPNGATLTQEGTTPWTNDIKNTTVFARMDWILNADHRVYFRVNSQNYSGENNTYPQTRKTNVAASNNSHNNFKSLSFVTELSSTLTPSLLNEVRLQISSENRPTTPNSTISTEISVGGVTFGQYNLDPRNTKENVTQFIDNLTWVQGDWLLKGGVNLQSIDMENTFLQYGNGQYSFGTYDSATQWDKGVAGLLGNPSTFIQYTQTLSPLGGHLKFNNKSYVGYVNAQYTGFLDHRLLLSLGARYTRETWDGNPNPNPKLAGLDAWPTNSSLDPRFGFSLDIFGNAKSVLRGGYGQFTIGNPGQTVSGGIMNNGINYTTYRVSVSSTGSAALKSLFQSGVLSASQRLLNGSITSLNGTTLLATPLLSGSAIVTPIDPNSKMTQNRRMSLGFEQDLGNGYKAALTAKYSKFNNLQYSVNINLHQMSWNGTAWVDDPGSFYNDGYPTKTNHFDTTKNRPGTAIVRGHVLDLTGYGDVFLNKTDGEGDYKALAFEASRRQDDGFGFRLTMTLAKATDNNSNEVSTLGAAASNVNYADPTGLTTPSDNDIKFRSVLALYAPPVWGFRVSGLLQYQTGRPYSATVFPGDPNGDNNTFSDFYYAGRNGYRQPSYRAFDMRIARTFHLTKKLSMEGIIDIYNVFNWANFTTGSTNAATYSATPAPDGTYTPLTNFGWLNVADAKTREVQFSIKFNY